MVVGWLMILGGEMVNRVDSVWLVITVGAPKMTAEAQQRQISLRCRQRW